MTDRLGTALRYLIAFVPLYIFVLSPLLRIFDIELGGGGGYTDLGLPALTDKDLTGPDARLIGVNASLVCPEHRYGVHVLSQSPLIVYVEDFLSAEEADQLVEESLPHFAPSTITNGSDPYVDRSIRASDVALLPRSPTVRCIEQRALAFQGWRPHVYIERLLSQRYNASGHYRHHFDWTGGNRRADRVSTFNVYLGDDCAGGGTNFPRLRRPAGTQWCAFIECPDLAAETDPDTDTAARTGAGAAVEGVTFKPIKGNAVFWENWRPDGNGYKETWHAGLPVRSGTKVGLNIWSWYQPTSTVSYN